MCARQSLGKEDSKATSWKPFNATRRVQVPSGKAGQQPEPSVAGVRRYALPNETPEAYTGSRQALGLNHEIPFIVGADAVMAGGRQHVLAEGPDEVVPPGSETRACLHRGSSRNLGDPAVSSSGGTERRGNEPLRKDGRESEHLHSTEETGERPPKDPVEGRRVSDHGTTGGKDGWEP